MNKPGIPNEGDTVRITDVGERDSYYKDEDAINCRNGVVTFVEVKKDNWLTIQLNNDYAPNYDYFYNVKVKIIRRKKEKNNDKS